MNPGRGLVLALLLGATALPGALGGQAGTGTIAGTVLAAGAPMPYSLVALYPERAGTVRAALTDRNGGFAFAAVPPGRYRLALERVGGAAEASASITVMAGSRRRADLRAEARRPPPLPMPGADTACRPPASPGAGPGLARLWDEIRKAATARLIFDRGHRYTLTVRELSWIVTGARDSLRSPGEERDVVRRPDVSSVDDGSVPLFGSSQDDALRLLTPDLPILIRIGFLATHCVAAVPAPPGERRVRFAPQNTPDYVQVRLAGTIVLDPHGAIDRLELEYLVGDRVVARGIETFADVGLPGGQLRFPRRLDLEQVPRLAGTPRWIGRTRYDDYRDWRSN